MDKCIQRAFEPIQADEGLRAKVLESTRRARPRPALRLSAPLAALACLLLVAVGLGGYRLWYTPVSYISVDINPSIELSLNTFDRVVEAQALNPDAEAVLAQVSLAGQSYSQAIDRLLGSAPIGRLLSDDPLLSFTVISDREEELILGIEGSSLGQYRYSCGSAEVSSISQAHHYGLSFGKYRMYQEVAQYDESFTPEQCHGMTTGELAERAAAGRGHAANDSPTSGTGHGSGGRHQNGHRHGRSDT